MLAASLEILERAQVPPLQARAIVQAIELELIAQHDILATKQDLGVVANDVGLLKQDLALFRHEMGEFRHEIRHDLQEMRHDLEMKIEKVRQELVRWVFTVFLGQTAVLLGAAYFFLAHFSR